MHHTKGEKRHPPYGEGGGWAGAFRREFGSAADLAVDQPDLRTSGDRFFGLMEKQHDRIFLIVPQVHAGGQQDVTVTCQLSGTKGEFKFARSYTAD